MASTPGVIRVRLHRAPAYRNRPTRVRFGGQTRKSAFATAMSAFPRRKADIAAVSGRGLGFVPKRRDQRHRRRARSSDPGLQDPRHQLAARARQRVHGQPDRGDRRAVVAGDGRPRPAAPAGLTPRATIIARSRMGSGGKPPRAGARSNVGFYISIRASNARSYLKGPAFPATCFW
jgi:hypothetical protein